MFKVIDKITRRLINEQHEKVLKKETDLRGNPSKELTDLSGSIWLDDETPIFMFDKEMIENAYCFLPYQVYMAVKNKIKRIPNHNKSDDGLDWSFCTYALKKGQKIKVHAG